MRVQSNGKIRRTASEWSAILEAHEASGLSEAAFCRRKKISKNTFSKWKKRLSGPRRKPAVRRAPMPGFIEWEAPSPAEGALAGAKGVPAEFELSLPGGVVLRWKA